MLGSPLSSLTMLGMAVVALLVSVVLAGVLWLCWLLKSHGFLDENSDPMRNLRGLEAPFFKPRFGDILSASSIQHNEWAQSFGRTFKFNGFGKWDYRLVTTDIRSLNHIINSPIYEKPWQTQKFLSSFLGRGIFAMEGAEHARQRKVVAPAFSATNVRQLYAPIFVDKAAELCDAWNDIVSPNEPTKIDVLHWAGRATLDVIGLASFDHNFNALQKENEDIYIAYKKMFDTIYKGPPPAYLLELLFPWTSKIWSSQFSKTIKECLGVIHRFGNMAVNNKKSLASYGSAEPFYENKRVGTDLLSRLVDVNTNTSIPPSERLTMQELLDQINTFLFAGSDTTSLGIAWCLSFLSQNSSIQSRLREELLSISPASTQQTFASQIEALPLLDKVVKETLRLSPPVHSTIRVATEDDVIPLSEPLTLRDGSTTAEVNIRKGSWVHIPLEGFNTSVDVWGPTATVFDPERWETTPGAAKTHQGFAGLLTFSFGTHACPGWKFAVLEMKVFIARLVAGFVLSPAEDIDRNNDILQRPYIKDKRKLGPTLPLNVTPYSP